MKYLTQDDIIASSYERFIDESTKDNGKALDKCEARAIAIAKTYIEGRYDTDSIFPKELPPDEEGAEPETIPGLRHELLITIIGKLTLYNVFRRNAARKVPEDIKEDHDWAIKELERIRAGSAPLTGLPPAMDNSGNPVSHAIWGNNTEPDYYI